MSVRPLRAGELRHRILMQTRIIARSAHGGFSYSWRNDGVFWAKISPKTGREMFFSDAVKAEATHFITMRVQSLAITPDMRIARGDRVFHIISSLLIDEIRHEIQIAAIETPGSAETATGTTDLITTYQTDEIDFTQTQQITKSMPTNKRFYPDSFEIVCTTAGGVVSTQPTITLGISGNTTKYASKTPTLLTAANKRQGYSGLSANEGETALILAISGAGAIGAGTYRGYLIVKGVLVG